MSGPSYSKKNIIRLSGSTLEGTSLRKEFVPQFLQSKPGPSRGDARFSGEERAAEAV